MVALAHGLALVRGTCFDGTTDGIFASAFDEMVESGNRCQVPIVRH